jgi:hypothetical protein
LRGRHRRRVVPGLLLFSVIYRESDFAQAAIEHRLDSLSNGDDLAGVYIAHALPVVQQQLLNAGICLAKIIGENF